MQQAYWQHPNGQIWAVETENGQPVTCCGPVDVRDVDLLLLPCLDYSTRDVGFLRAEWRSCVRFVLCSYVLCSACGGAVLPGSATAATGRVHLACSLKPPTRAEASFDGPGTRRTLQKLIADLEDFAVSHRPHGRLIAATGAVTPSGYRLAVACPCGVTFERWITPEEAAGHFGMLSRLN